MTGLGERVRYRAWRKRGITWMQAESIVAHSHHKLPPDNIKPLVLKMVSVKRRTTLRLSECIVNAQVATRVAARDLQIKAPSHDQQIFLVAILLRSDPEPPPARSPAIFVSSPRAIIVNAVVAMESFRKFRRFMASGCSSAERHRRKRRDQRLLAGSPCYPFLEITL